MTQSARTGGPAAEPHAPTEARPPQRSESGAPIAIIGMACRFPGADDIGAFWRLLEAGANAVQEGELASGEWARCSPTTRERSTPAATAPTLTRSTSSMPPSSASRPSTPCCRWSGMAGMPFPGHPPTPLTARLSLSAVRSGAWESDAKDCRFGRRPPWQGVRCCRAGRRTATDGPVPRASARVRRWLGRSPNIDPAGSPIDARWN